MVSPLHDFDGWLDEHAWPRVPCPVCTVGTVGYGDSTHRPNRASEEILDLARKNLGPPDELEGTFEGSLTCDNPKCRQTLSMAGDWQCVINEGDPSLGTFGDIYRVQYVNPPLKILIVPPSTPKAVKEAIESASVILWLSPSASANRLRHAVEELLTAQKIKKTTINKSGKREKLKLHDRIVAFSKTHKEVADALEAVKWIGNGGSHDSTLTVPDVLIGAEILEVAIKSLYDKSDAALMAKVKKINKAKGLPKKKS